MQKLEFFFDCSSPWTYIAFHNILRLRDELAANVSWRPILVGAVFNAVNESAYQFRENLEPPKEAYLAKDLQDWASLTGLRLNWQPTIFPINSVRAMRGCIIADDQAALEPFARAVFEMYWGDDLDICQDEVLLRAAETAGIDGPALLRAIELEQTKQRLRKNTDELIQRGGFGSPTMFVGGDDMYFGNDRIVLVRNALLRSA